MGHYDGSAIPHHALNGLLNQLLSLGIVQRNESGAVNSVLNAAALTYVAAMVSSLLTLLYWLSILRGSDRDR